MHYLAEILVNEREIERESGSSCKHVAKCNAIACSVATGHN